MLNLDMGFSTENILNVDVQGNDIALLEAEFRKNPEVIDVSFPTVYSGTNQMIMAQVVDSRTGDSLFLTYNVTEPNYGSS